MNETEQQKDQALVDHEPQPVDPSQVLSPKRRVAVVSYLAMLFAVAFLLVAIVMVLETKRLKTMNQELKDSSQRTSASLTNNINALQAENQVLSETNKNQAKELDQLRAQLAESQREAADKDAKIQGLELDKESLEQEKAELETQAEALTQQVQDAIQVSELIYQAVEADDHGRMTELKELLEKIEPLKELLSETELELYENLQID
ncbi:MAG: hypothetical protein IKS05_08880 [Oscillospiraceae bacterium]|nr:hypothetical protein [Oscillospiraceae bacterium]